MKDRTVTHFEAGVRVFTADNRLEFIEFTQAIFSENEEPDTTLKIPHTVGECTEYIDTYCDNFEITVTHRK